MSDVWSRMLMCECVWFFFLFFFISDIEFVVRRFFCAIASMIANKCMQQRVAVVVVVFYFDFIKSSSECVGSRFCGGDTLHNVNNNDNKKRVA